MEDRFDRLEQMLGGLSAELRAVETRLRGHIEDVDAHISGNLATIDRELRVLIAEKGEDDAENHPSGAGTGKMILSYP